MTDIFDLARLYTSERSAIYIHCSLPSFINRNALCLILNPGNTIVQERVASIKNTASNYVLIFALHY